MSYHITHRHSYVHFDLTGHIPPPSQPELGADKGQTIQKPRIIPATFLRNDAEQVLERIFADTGLQA
jgi:hypothetical protein